MPKIVSGVGAAERDVEDRSALVHLPEQPAPRRLRPAGVGDGPVQVARAQVVPEARRSDVAKRVGLRVLDHLRVGDRAAREVQQQRIVAMRSGRPASPRPRPSRQRSSNDSQPSGAPPDAQPGREIRDGRIDLRRARLVGDRRGRAGLIEAVRDVLRSQQVRARHRDRADPHRAKQRRVPLRDPRQHHEHVVALADAELEQRARRLARGARQVGRRLLGDNLADRVDGQHRERVGVLRGPRLDDVQHGVEALRHLDAVARALGVEVGEPRSAVARGASQRGDSHRSTLRDRHVLQYPQQLLRRLWRTTEPCSAGPGLAWRGESGAAHEGHHCRGGRRMGLDGDTLAIGGFVGIGGARGAVDGARRALRPDRRTKGPHARVRRRDRATASVAD